MKNKLSLNMQQSLLIINFLKNKDLLLTYNDNVVRIESKKTNNKILSPIQLYKIIKQDDNNIYPFCNGLNLPISFYGDMGLKSISDNIFSILDLSRSLMRCDVNFIDNNINFDNEVSSLLFKKLNSELLTLSNSEEYIYIVGYSSIFRILLKKENYKDWVLNEKQAFILKKI